MKTMTLRSAWPIIKHSLLLLTAVTAPIFLVYAFRLLQDLDPTIGLLDAGIWQLLLFSMLSFMGITALAWWILQKAWVSLGLPKIQLIVSQFKTLTLCQQFAFYWASFALLLLVAVLSLVAIF